jgi:hypothetical protein
MIGDADVKAFRVEPQTRRGHRAYGLFLENQIRRIDKLTEDGR